MGAQSVTGVGLGSAGLKVAPVSNVNHVMFANSNNDGNTIGDAITVVFLEFDADYTLNLPNPQTSVGKMIYFRSRATGHTVTLNNIGTNPYSFSSSYVNFTVISDGSVWNITNWYSDD
jgi:hypothetical protein